MDNNFNGQQIAGQPAYTQPVQPAQQPVYQAQPQQPVYQAQPQQPVYQAQPQQPVYAQAPSPVYQPQQVPKQPSKINVLELIAIICSGVGALFAILGTTFMCACSASETYNYKREDYGDPMFVSHPIMVLAIIGGLVAIAGVVLAIIATKQKNAAVKAGKLAWVAAIVGVFATLYAFLPTFTICGYNCSLESAKDNMIKKQQQDYQDSLEDAWGNLFD